MRVQSRGIIVIRIRVIFMEHVFILCILDNSGFKKFLFISFWYLWFKDWLLWSNDGTPVFCEGTHQNNLGPLLPLRSVDDSFDDVEGGIGSPNRKLSEVITYLCNISLV
jgi:hypothetical protein